MVRDVLTNVNHEGKAIVITTFSSHLARLKSIIEFGKKLNRKIIFAGRSLSKYVDAGHETGIIDFRKDIQLIKYKTQIKKKFRKIEKNKDKFLIVCTGHQGEKQAVLSKIVDKVIPFKLENGDHVIFSCAVIPAEVNRKNRNDLEKKLMARGVRIFRDIHVSGHASREDHRELIDMVRPKHIIPAHGDAKITTPLIELAKTIGYKKGKTVHQMKDGKRIKLH
jgi:ribonuclease J